MTEIELKLDWNLIQDTNVRIGTALKFEPVIEWAVGDGEGYCYNPGNIKERFSTPELQKQECERWLKEQSERFPEGWVTKGNYRPIEIKHYPQFHRDWKALVEAVQRLNSKGIQINFVPNIEIVWNAVAENCH